jgi:hypothetical protein
MDISEFARLFFGRAEGISKAKIPKATEDAFVAPQTEAEREIKAAIDASSMPVGATDMAGNTASLTVYGMVPAQPSVVTGIYVDTM